MSKGAEEPTTYFVPTDNINLDDLFYFDVKEKYFAIRIVIISVTFIEGS